MIENSEPLNYGNSASLAKRFYANFLDVIIALVISAIIYALFQRNRELNEILVTIGFFSYYLFIDIFNKGQGVEKKIFEIAVVSKTSRKPCNFLQSFGRKTSLLILGFIDVIFIISKSKRRLGDYLARTEVLAVLQVPLTHHSSETPNGAP